ncbi:PspA/IM30 family protein [Streptomyces sp. TRM49041]|uniref:PspA/IM30 family protein n=1 Tax=Streptomyces sp. TRM49041 TaxID=2603216 RepID=UPI0011EF67C0|nr:PspA/IM30 family protein [Streptomyces sp. TRM49041]
MTKHSILGRVTQLARANVRTVLDQAVDREEMLDQLIQEYAFNIGEAEKAVAMTLADLRLLEEDHREDLDAAREWGEKARVASAKADSLRASDRPQLADRFDTLARVALERQLQSEKNAKAAEPMIAAQRAVVQYLQNGLEGMRATDAALCAERDELFDPRRTVAAHDALLDAISDLGILDPTNELMRFEAKVRREEAKALGKQELIESSLDGVFERLDSLGDTAEVEARLAALKSAA